MKRFALAVVCLMLLGSLTASAQGLIVKAGLNYNNSTVQGIKEGRSGWQLGAGFQTETASGFSFQPELVYKVMGYKMSDIQNLNLGYLEVPLNVQWGPNLLIARPFIFAGPYVGIKVSNQFRGSNWTETDMEQVTSGLKKAEWGLGLGIGLNVMRFQIAGKYNWNFGAIADTAQMPSLADSPRTLEISLGLRF